MKVFLGGVPFGCDNIGDEAILESVVAMLRKSIKEPLSITVATADPATASRLGVDVEPAFGFAGVPRLGFIQALKGHDAYIWCGATGLSDYPHVALDLLETALDERVPSFIWGVGMDDELNPVFFKAAGRRRRVLAAFGLVGLYEHRLRSKLKRRISRLLPRCAGVWLRDRESAAVLARMGFRGAGVAVDTAFALRPAASDLKPQDAPRLGICISTQRQVSDMEGLKRMLKAVRDSGADILGIPMNPKTDRQLLDSLGVECIEGTDPADVMEAASRCSVVLSSRLHLLILAANAGVPILGIARGSKLANWLANFDRTVEGSVYDCDWDKVTADVLGALASRGNWDEVRAKAYETLQDRFDEAKGDFIGRLLECVE